MNRQEVQKESSLNIVRGLVKISSALINADTLLDEHSGGKFNRKLKFDVLNFNNWFSDFTRNMMVKLISSQEELILEINKSLDKYEKEVCVDDDFTHEMVFYLAKLQSGINNLKQIEYPDFYLEYTKPIISRAENLMSKGHIQRLDILNQKTFIKFVEHFDILGKELVPT